MIALEKVKNKIRLDDYSLKEIAIYFEKYDNAILKIETYNNLIIKVKIYKNIFPHLIGLQHIFTKNKSKNEYKGTKGFENILNEKITWKTIKENTSKNSSINIKKIKRRIEYLIMFFNTIEKRSYLKELDKTKSWRYTLLNGKYILYKKVYENENIIYPILSIKEIKNNNYRIETFIVDEDFLLVGGLNSLKIKSINLIMP